MKIEINKTRKFMVAFVCAQVFFGLMAEKSMSATKVNWKWAKQSNCFWEQNPCEDARHHFNEVKIDDADNSTVVVGEFTGYFTTDTKDVVSNNTAVQGLIAKYDKNGKNVWTNQIATILPEEGAFTQCRGVAIDNNGNIYVSGYFQGNRVSFGLDLQGNDVIKEKLPGDHLFNSFIVKLDKNGKVLNVFISNLEVINDLVVTPVGLSGIGGDIYFTGAYSKTGVANVGQFALQASEDEQFIMAKMTSNFNVAWVRSSYGQSEGGHIEIDQANNAVYAYGGFSGTLSVLPYIVSTENPGSFFYVKIDATTGATKWLKKIIDGSYGMYGHFKHAKKMDFVVGDLTLDKQGDLYMVGNYSGFFEAGHVFFDTDQNGDGPQAFVLKASRIGGEPIWGKDIVNKNQDVSATSVVWYENQVYVGANSVNGKNASFITFLNSGNGDLVHIYDLFESDKHSIEAMYVNQNTGSVSIAGNYSGTHIRLGDLAKPELGNAYWILGTIGNEVEPFKSRTGYGGSFPINWQHGKNEGK